jgi:hypothetical protein
MTYPLDRGMDVPQKRTRCIIEEKAVHLLRRMEQFNPQLEHYTDGHIFAPKIFSVELQNDFSL